MKKFLPKYGFTLIELMVAVTIIAVLSVIGMTVYTNVQRNARDVRRKEDIDAIQKALEVHYNNSINQYCTAAAGTYCTPLSGTSWFSAGVIPTDPKNVSPYTYTGLPSDGATTYHICATLESGGSYCKDNLQ